MDTFAKRIIPCLDVKDGRVVKGVGFVGLKDAGDPVEIARRYNDEGADELCFLDITASHENRDTIVHIVQKVAKKLFIPLTVGGGIRKIDDISRLLAVGCDKVSLNSAAIFNPDLISQAAAKFGSQCVVVAIDAKKVANLGGENFCQNGENLGEKFSKFSGENSQKFAIFSKNKDFAKNIKNSENVAKIFAKNDQNLNSEFFNKNLSDKTPKNSQNNETNTQNFTKTTNPKITTENSKNFTTINPTTTQKYNVFINGGRVDTGIDAIWWARRAYELGAGEILLTSMDADGTKNGYDLALTAAISAAVPIPVIASGGAGTMEHILEAFRAGADAALAASIFHYREIEIKILKEFLRKNGVGVRI